MKSEKLAYWYFRLNGFLTTPNYIIHNDVGGSQRTEFDILSVRFPYKAEILEDKMDDEAIFGSKKNKPYIIIADATIGDCKLNNAWIDPKKKNIHSVLRVVGAIKEENIDEVAQQLYKDGFFENYSCCLSLFCVGKSIDSDLQSKYPKVPQKTWNNVLEFIYNRFVKYEVQKRDHSQWDCDGKQLWNFFECNKRNKSNFKNEIISCLEP